MVEGIHVEDIFELLSLVLFLIKYRIFRILAHEEDQHTVVFRKYLATFCLKHLATPFLVSIHILVEFAAATHISKWSPSMAHPVQL